MCTEGGDGECLLMEVDGRLLSVLLLVDVMASRNHNGFLSSVELETTALAVVNKPFSLSELGISTLRALLALLGRKSDGNFLIGVVGSEQSPSFPTSVLAWEFKMVV